MGPCHDVTDLGGGGGDPQTVTEKMIICTSVYGAVKLICTRVYGAVKLICTSVYGNVKLIGHKFLK